MLRRHRTRRALAVGLCTAVAAGCISFTLATTGSGPGGPTHVALHLASDTVGNATFAEAAPTQLAEASLQLTPATNEPAPAPPSVADEPALASHEVFAFAPYWTLSQSTTFDVAGLSTIAYFAVGVHADGSLDQSGPGWEGFESQQLTNLISRSHAAGDRVVLAVNCFSQTTLNALTSSPTAPATLSSALASALEAKRLDGVNLDFEGVGNEDQRGLTNLVSAVSSSLHAVDPGWQVTMDTYASSAGDPTGFFDIPALNPVVNGFFVMAYQLNLGAQAGSGSPLTDGTLTNEDTVAQYAAVVTPKKVVLGLATFGYDWPTETGALGASALGPPSVITYGQEIDSGHPMYWDPVTDTGWTSYTSDGQWHEAFFEDPESLYLAAQLAQSAGLAGVGEWALGFDGNRPTVIDALDGMAPPEKSAGTGPSATAVAPPATTTSGPTTPTSAEPSSSAAVVPGYNGAGTTTAGSPAGSPPGSDSPTTPATAPLAATASASGTAPPLETSSPTTTPGSG